MTIDQQIHDLRQQYDLVSVIELDQWHTMPYEQAQIWLENQLSAVYSPAYSNNQRVLCVMRRGDVYVKNDSTGLIVKNLQVIANEKDISNYFLILISNNPKLDQELDTVKTISSDPVPITGIYCEDGAHKITVLDSHPGSRKEFYQYGSVNPIKVSLNQLTEREQFLLADSKVFCIYPWTHLHAWPTGQAFPCCMSEPVGQVGNCKDQTLQQIWNGSSMRELRLNMLNEQRSAACTRCYEQDEAGFFSGRKSANKHHGHLINRVAETQPDGTLDRFQMTYWDIRFSNLCNLSCRSCGHIFSSSWYQDQVQLAGNEYALKNQALNYAGRTETDIWEQLVPHLDYVEQIYFAGGEPLMMKEHYNILDELERRGRYDVRLIYNTNFSHVRLKDRTVFDYWRRFKSVSVGASLDAMGARAEYIRRGTEWDTVERNRSQMMEICPNVDFYISPTLSIMNAHHLPDFHRDWVDRGLIRAQDLNVNILQDPAHYRIDIAPAAYKDRLRERYQQHLEWLRPLDQLRRATVGFESAINFMDNTDNSQLIPSFWQRTRQLDKIRNEDALSVLPELEALL